ncbi:hypothetical protein PUN28_009188 [Cardiocondyla obscurior]|uniref:Uncharacterized protein n=1 Tax=Cardiocondyla obscurior TaxID=286306 RepID=A0AAW2FWN0_9HYME
MRGSSNKSFPRQKRSRRALERDRERKGAPSWTSNLYEIARLRAKSRRKSSIGGKDSPTLLSSAVEKKFFSIR